MQRNRRLVARRTVAGNSSSASQRSRSPGFAPAPSQAQTKRQAVPGRDHLHGHPGHRPERRRHVGDRRVDHQAGRRDPRLPADPARHRQGAVGRPRALERHEPRALVREVLREREGRAERRGDRGRRADGHHGGALHRQAQSACLDVAHQRARSTSRTSARRSPSTTRPTPRPTPRTPPPMPPRSRPSTSRCASASRPSPRRSAGSSPARAPSATSPATTG